MTLSGGNKLQILLQCADLREASEWKLLNEGWIAAGHDRIYNISFTTGQLECVDMATLEPTLPANEAAELVLCAPVWNLTPGWRDAVRRASALFQLKSVTGRRLVEDPRLARVGHEDTTPGQLSPYVTEWNLSGALHGVGCRRLPPDLLWISTAARSAMVHCLAMSSSVDDAAKAFYDETLMPKNFGKNLYLPDFVAFHR